MLHLRDPHVRLVVLSHLAWCAAAGAKADLLEAGIDEALVQRMRAMSVEDLIDLAEVPWLPLHVVFDFSRVEAALRAVSLQKEAKSLELYFVRNGASSRMLHALFRTTVKKTLRRRRECGSWLPPGRARLPEAAVQDQIIRVWSALQEQDPRMRYYKLHREFPELAIAILETVVLNDAESK